MLATIIMRVSDGTVALTGWGWVLILVAAMLVGRWGSS